MYHKRYPLSLEKSPFGVHAPSGQERKVETMPLSRRDLVKGASYLLGASVVSKVTAATRATSSGNSSESLLYYKPPVGGMWDNIIHYFDGTYYLYFQDRMPPNGIGLSTSRDLIKWEYRGTAING